MHSHLQPSMIAKQKASCTHASCSISDAFCLSRGVQIIDQWEMAKLIPSKLICSHSLGSERATAPSSLFALCALERERVIYRFRFSTRQDAHTV